MCLRKRVLWVYMCVPHEGCVQHKQSNSYVNLTSFTAMMSNEVWPSSLIFLFKKILCFRRDIRF